MPDIRIKDLTTTASTTADDFFAADGATNGTRKLSAYSPTFGGNATVSGTLTVNSTADFLLKNGAWYSSAESSQRLLFSTSGTSYLKGHGAGQVVVLRNGSDSAAVTVYADLSTAFAGKVEATATTASTSTSSGALVVGNGTSGGLGVGGAIFAGGNIQCNAVFAANSTTLLLRPNGASVSSGQLSVETSGNTTISATTASTSTSSGALVVSGGVGVAGALSIGGNVLIDKASPEVLMKRGANTDDGLLKFQTGVFGDFGIGHRGTTDSDLHIYNYGTAADALKIAKSDSLATFSAAIRTAAPSGGTAASWKLGTVATVSPTSPNRTIEVDIGGTIYYLAAKTTNN